MKKDCLIAATMALYLASSMPAAADDNVEVPPLRLIYITGPALDDEAATAEEKISKLEDRIVNLEDAVLILIKDWKARYDQKKEKVKPVKKKRRIPIFHGSGDLPTG